MTPPFGRPVSRHTGARPARDGWPGRFRSRVPALESEVYAQALGVFSTSPAALDRPPPFTGAGCAAGAWSGGSSMLGDAGRVWWAGRVREGRGGSRASTGGQELR